MLSHVACFAMLESDTDSWRADTCTATIIPLVCQRYTMQSTDLICSHAMSARYSIVTSQDWAQQKLGCITCRKESIGLALSQPLGLLRAMLLLVEHATFAAGVTSSPTGLLAD